MFANRTRVGVLALIVLLVLGGVGGGIYYWVRKASAPTGLAIVNSDTGPTGAKIVKALTDAHNHPWTAVKPGEASTSDYAAVITLPADLSTSLGTLASTKPKKAKLTVDTNRDADTRVVDDAVDEVTKRISAAGVDTALAVIALARGDVQQVQFTAQLLNAGVQAAAGASTEFSGGAQQMLDFLATAKDGAGSLTSGIDQLNGALAAATKQAGSLADTLDQTGVTIGQITSSSAQLTSGLDVVLPLLHALPFANDPAVTDIITKLEALRGVSSGLGKQLTDFANLTGTSSDPNTSVGQLLRDASAKLGTAGDQLNQGASLAKQIPALADQGSQQISGALGALSSGVTQLQQIVNNLNTQTGAALNALPARSDSTASAIANTISDPVDVVRN
ncbi:YhgE/Pip domain-containing protein [Nocardia stercoris]|uniref:Uncharacterized protein n=1 Tax=Nocardia stercoris TaxID=2483361 RepID=A0A3M2KZ03_9NOCA|nr:hypothetical protein [Nocardia stercoris]RMI29670.1 hypothetical protein EBN03_25050 [Nocardia stercoris]